jgi:hypothetical protein
VTHLEVHVPSLPAANGPFSFNDEYGNSADATLADPLNLVFNRLDVFVRVEVGGGLT